MATTLLKASAEWASRPDDQRYLSLEDLAQAVGQRKAESWTLMSDARDLRVKANPRADDGHELMVEAYDPTIGDNREMAPTHWGFGQLATYAQAPAHYLRALPPELAAINLQWGLEKRSVRENALVMGQTNGDTKLRSMTSQSYGRIWDSQVVEAVERVNQDGRWQIPAASYTASNPKRATTLYASDRDVFLFLVDPVNAIEVGNDTLFRGFYTWNSEVGAQTFGLSTFLYRYVCDNRMIWGATDVKEIRIRHTRGAPDRFAYEGAGDLNRYAQEGTGRLIESIEKAKAFEVPQADKEGQGWEKWLTNRGFTGTQAKAAVQTAKAEEGEARSLWDIINGITANARSIPHTDERIKVETQAGKLMRYVDGS